MREKVNRALTIRDHGPTVEELWRRRQPHNDLAIPEGLDIIDVGNWDASLAMNAPGQSGNMHSPHYTDQFEMWAQGEAFPLLYTRDSIEAAAEHIIKFTPPANKGVQR